MYWSKKYYHSSVSTPTCFKNELFCDGECKLVFKCDGENDCDDGADEKNCGMLYLTCVWLFVGVNVFNCKYQFSILLDAITCAISTEALCDDGKSCVMNYKFCDGKNDCLDGSDEKSSRCDKSKTTGYYKFYKRCINTVTLMSNVKPWCIHIQVETNWTLWEKKIPAIQSSNFTTYSLGYFSIEHNAMTLLEGWKRLSPSAKIHSPHKILRFIYSQMLKRQSWHPTFLTDTPPLKENRC